MKEFLEKSHNEFREESQLKSLKKFYEKSVKESGEEFHEEYWYEFLKEHRSMKELRNIFLK